MNKNQITACILAGLLLLAALVLIRWLFTPPSPEAAPGSAEHEVRELMGGPAADPANDPNLAAVSLLTNRSDFGATNPLGLPLVGQMLETNLIEPAMKEPVHDADYLQPAAADAASRSNVPFLLPR